MNRTQTSGTSANRIGNAFYVVAAIVAFAGATTAAVEWLGWPLIPAAAAVAVFELGAIALTARADLRRRLGERAVAARLLSAAAAMFAVAFQWLGHSDHRQGLFFAGTSALAYATWLVNSADRRRDALRADGKLPPTPPVYGLVQWAQHPMLTRRARHLALQQPALGLYGSLTAAAAQKRTEVRQAALAGLLRRKLSAGRDPLAAEIAVTTYDLDEIAARLAASADYDGLTALIAAELQPARLAGDAETAQLLPTMEPIDADPVEPATRPEIAPEAAPKRTEDDAPEETTSAGQKVRQDPRTKQEIEIAVRAVRALDTSLSQRRIAAIAMTSPSTVGRILGPANAAPVSGPPAVDSEPEDASRMLAEATAR